MKNLKLTSLFLMLALGSYAQTDTCKVLLGKISGNYTGECLNGLANGKGKSAGEDTYTGTFSNGLPEGKGKYLYKNGDVFQGNWHKGQKDGKGKFEYTLNGKKYTLNGYWKNDEYAGVTEPDIAYSITSATGLVDYKVEKIKPVNEKDKEIVISIKSAFMDFVPVDLKIEKSSGQIVQTGKKFSITQYYCPLHCEISYTIAVGNDRKQCRFIVDILKEGKYSISLHND